MNIYGTAHLAMIQKTNYDIAREIMKNVRGTFRGKIERLFQQNRTLLSVKNNCLTMLENNATIYTITMTSKLKIMYTFNSDGVLFNQSVVHKTGELSCIQTIYSPFLNIGT